MKGATEENLAAGVGGNVSIRAPREGGDNAGRRVYPLFTGFNPRPREGGDFSGCAIIPITAPFQSAPPVKGATFEA